VPRKFLVQMFDVILVEVHHLQRALAGGPHAKPWKWLTQFTNSSWSMLSFSSVSILKAGNSTFRQWRPGGGIGDQVKAHAGVARCSLGGGGWAHSLKHLFAQVVLNLRP
jgi:hypothetical protein